MQKLFKTLTICLLVSTGALHAMEQKEKEKKHEPGSSFPLELSQWSVCKDVNCHLKTHNNFVGILTGIQGFEALTGTFCPLPIHHSTVSILSPAAVHELIQQNKKIQSSSSPFSIDRGVDSKPKNSFHIHLSQRSPCEDPNCLVKKTHSNFVGLISIDNQDLATYLVLTKPFCLNPLNTRISDLSPAKALNLIIQDSQ